MKTWTLGRFACLTASQAASRSRGFVLRSKTSCASCVALQQELVQYGRKDLPTLLWVCQSSDLAYACQNMSKLNASDSEELPR